MIPRPNTIGLDDDLDSVDLLRDLRAAFGLTLPDHEAQTCYTVGDLYRRLQAGFANAPNQAAGCATAMAFYRLRRACSAAGKIRPSTPLADLHAASPRRLFRDIAKTSGLKLPPLEPGPAGLAGTILMGIGAIGIFAFLISGSAWRLLAQIIAILGAVAFRFDPKAFPKTIQTMGELARATAALNFATMVGAGAAPREADLWAALTEILALNSTLPKAEIHPETWLLASQFDAWQRQANTKTDGGRDRD